ncbi:AsmA family protein [Methylobacillus gramineus]|uniref:AsmA family protein n=1 Tax=Methylobacillus gramineus TaxID=755169 RepID=UPI001CFF84C2|nr:AsmA family protein [Methylobacillus gramineus]MCB5184031.1 AsmA family protein [Methylobacillus gramineus]
MAEQTVKASSRTWLTPIKGVLWLLLGLIIAIVVCEVLGWPFLREPAEKFLNDKLERTVKLEQPFQLHLWAGVQLDVGHLFIAAPSDFKVPHLVDAHNISLKLRYRDLWQYTKDKQLRIREIKVDQIDAQLLRRTDGSSTWQFPKDESQPDSPFPIIETLIVKNGSSKIDDAQTQAVVDAKFKTEEGSNSQEAMHSELSITGKFQHKPIKAFLETAGFLPIATQDKNSAPIKSKGWLEYAKLRVDFDGQISDLFGQKNIQGKAIATGSSLGVLGDLVGTPLPTTDPFRLSATLDKSADIWNIDIDSAKVGRSSLSAQFKYDPRTADAVPLLQGHIDGSRFYLADLAPAFGTAKIDGSKALPADGRAIPNRPLDLPSLNRMDMEISLKLDYVELGQAFALPIAPLKGNLTVLKGRFTVGDILAKTADGTLSGTLSVDAGEPEKDKNKQQYAPQWQIKLAWKDIVLEKWLQVSKTRQEEAKKKGKEVPPPYVTGTLNGKTDLTGKGSSTAELLGSLNGKTTVFIERGQISRLIVELMGLDVAQSVSAWLGGDKSLNMQCALMDLKATNGIVKPEVALIDTPVTLLLINGNIDMGEEKLDLLLAAKPKNFSPLTVRSPIKVQGTFLQPKVSPETVPIAARLLGSVALAFINPLAAILPYLDTGSTSNSYSCSQALSHFNQQQNKP